MTKQSTDHQTYLWIDFETTGIDPAECQITEVGAILTYGPDTGFDEIERMATAIRLPYDTAWQRGALDMAKKSGLLDRLDIDDLPSLRRVRDEIARMILAYDQPILAARNAGFERGFIDAHLADLADRLHYRAFDVTPLCLIDPSLYDYDHGVEGRPHRALYDIERDLEYAREFVRRYQGVDQ